MAIFTIGHSTHKPQDFMELLMAAELDGIVDIRSHRSSKWPWWHAEQVEKWLPRGGFLYSWAPGLGGWDTRHANLVDWANPRGVKLKPYLGGYFPKQRIGADADQAYEHRPEWASKWTSQGLHDYAWFTALPEFQEAARRLVDEFAAGPDVAIMCSEVLWWKCHRSMVADVVTHAMGVPVTHVLPTTKGASLSRHNPEPRIDRYPPEVIAAWQR